MSRISNALVLFTLSLVASVLANTESIILQIPRYYNIPAHPSHFKSVHLNDSFSRTRFHTPVQLNSTHFLLDEYPIGQAESKRSSSPAVYTSISVAYDESVSSAHTLLVKLNNYHDSTYAGDDRIYVKLCWPATQPFSVDLDYSYIQTIAGKDLEKGDETTDDLLDVYVVVTYKADAYSHLADHKIENFSFNLHVTKLPWIPLPLEIIDLIVYLVNILIVAVLIVLPLLRSLV